MSRTERSISSLALGSTNLITRMARTICSLALGMIERMGVWMRIIDRVSKLALWCSSMVASY